jgi:SRSO17 transposase
MGNQLLWRLVVDADWQRDLEAWLEPFLKVLDNKTRRRMCPAYIAGLIGPGDRKSIQPMAARVDAVSYDRLHHFIAAGIWGQRAAGSDLVAAG